MKRRWFRLAGLPPGERHTGVVTHGKMHVLAGWYGVTVYDKEEDTWKKLKEFRPARRFEGSAAVTREGHVLLVGGDDEQVSTSRRGY